MSAAAIAALERALNLDDVNGMRFEIMSALGSLKQQPSTLNELTVHARLERAVAKFDSPSLAAAAWGVPRQTLHAVRNGDRPCPDKILRAIGLRRMPAGRTCIRRFEMQFLWGRARLPGELRFRSWNESSGRRHHRDIVHPLATSYGLVIGDRFFIGIMLFEERLTDEFTTSASDPL